jgi:hypothetical protein
LADWNDRINKTGRMNSVNPAEHELPFQADEFSVYLLLMGGGAHDKYRDKFFRVATDSSSDECRTNAANTNVPAATSPYTNNISAATKFFRLQAN